jgi:hypothetical protein
MSAPDILAYCLDEAEHDASNKMWSLWQSIVNARLASPNAAAA